MEDENVLMDFCPKCGFMLPKKHPKGQRYCKITCSMFTPTLTDTNNGGKNCTTSNYQKTYTENSNHTNVSEFVQHSLVIEPLDTNVSGFRKEEPTLVNKNVGNDTLIQVESQSIVTSRAPDETAKGVQVLCKVESDVHNKNAQEYEEECRELWTRLNLCLFHGNVLDVLQLYHI